MVFIDPRCSFDGWLTTLSVCRHDNVRTTEYEPLLIAGHDPEEGVRRTPGRIEPLRVGEDVDRGDPAAPDREGQDGDGRPLPPSDRTTTSGSRMAISASRSPSPAAAKNASTISRWPARPTSDAGTSVAALRRARLGVLPGGGRSPAADGGDLAERYSELVVQDERQPLGR
jgi:hypothetical protein